MTDSEIPLGYAADDLDSAVEHLFDAIECVRALQRDTEDVDIEEMAAKAESGDWSFADWKPPNNPQLALALEHIEHAKESVEAEMVDHD